MIDFAWRMEVEILLRAIARKRSNRAKDYNKQPDPQGHAQKNKPSISSHLGSEVDGFIYLITNLFLIIVSETFQLIGVASPVFVDLDIQFNVNLLSKEFL